MSKNQQTDLEEAIKEFGLNPKGQEVPNPTPLTPPVGYSRAPSLAEQIREGVRSAKLAEDLAAQGVETFEEADDFDVEDDDMHDPYSQWENEYDPPLSELIEAGKKIEADKKAQALQKAAQHIPKPSDIAPEGRQSQPPEPLKGEQPSAADKSGEK